MAEERLTDDPFKRSLEEEDLGLETDYDEDLVGLTPSQLEEKLEARRRAEERAKSEHDKFFAEAEEKFESGAYSEAAALYEQAALYEEEGGMSAVKSWRALTADFNDPAVFCENDVSERFSHAHADVRAAVLDRMGEPIRALRAELDGEAAPLRESVYGGMNSRRDAFRANRNYYLVRFLIALAALVCAAIACAVAGSFIIRTRGFAAPACTVAFGVAAVAAFAVFAIFARKLFVAQRLVSDNEKLSATQSGSALEALEIRIRALDTALAAPKDSEGGMSEEEGLETESEEN